MVFPTPVGVFLPSTGLPGNSDGLPHARGGVSEWDHRSGVLLPSSPRPWGCFDNLVLLAHRHQVFPTPVGVFPVPVEPGPAIACLPHARGGVSKSGHLKTIITGSSPRPWGCFRHELWQRRGGGVFPTPVGVFLPGRSGRLAALGLPHARGGVSCVCARFIQ